MKTNEGNNGIGSDERTKMNGWLRVKPDAADLEAHEEGEGHRYGHDPPRDHREEPPAEADAAVGLVG